MILSLETSNEVALRRRVGKAKRAHGFRPCGGEAVGRARGTLGARQVARSAPDGYTIMLGFTGTLAIAPSLYSNAGYNPRKDFAPIGRIGTAPSSLVVHPSFPARTVAELIAHAKQSPGKVSFGSAGIGSVNHVAGELFASMAEVKLLHVPYRGTGPALTDLL